MPVIELELPWPPSVNHYWRNVRGAMLISREGRAYRTAVLAIWLLAGRPRVEGRLSVEITAYAPDRRRRDLDNLHKAPLDALAKAGLYADDSQIDRLLTERGAVSPERPRLVVQIGPRMARA